jgi:hypothetical protein
MYFEGWMTRILPGHLLQQLLAPKGTALGGCGGQDEHIPVTAIRAVSSTEDRRQQTEENSTYQLIGKKKRKNYDDIMYNVIGKRAATASERPLVFRSASHNNST